MPLRRLPLDSTSLSRLDRLGIRTIRGFLALNAGSIASRFGSRAEVLHAFVAGRNGLPLQGREETPSYHLEQEMPSLLNRDAIASHLAPLLENLCSLLRSTGKRAAEFTVCLRDERGTEYREIIAPAEPSGDALFLHKLLLLRIYTRQIDARVVHATVSMSPAQELPGQAFLFSQQDDRGASWARARSLLQAEFGNEALVRVTQCDAHHPGERFRLVAEGDSGSQELSELQRASRLTNATPSATNGVVGRDGGSRQTERGGGESRELPVLVRRILFEPAPCTGIPAGVRFGPFRVSGRWWKQEGGRSYYYLWRERGPALWLYKLGKHTMLQGYVE